MRVHRRQIHQYQQIADIHIVATKGDTNKPLISASILSADFSDLAQEIKALEEAGVDAIHLDVMDGVFVPNLTFGPLVIEAVRRVTNLPLDVHLMIEHPAQYLSEYVDAGADWISIHIEACPHIHRDLTKIKDLGKRAGIAINPGTPVASLDSVMDEADFILVMSVNPGFGGQKFVSGTLDKLDSIRLIREQRGINLEIAVDGGIDATYAPLVTEAGATSLVIGSALFRDPGGASHALATILESVRAGGAG